VQRSKRRSDKPATSAAPRSDARFFIDRNIGRRIVPEALRSAGFPVVHHDDVFPDPTTPDEEWLARCGEERWIVVSADRAIRRKPNELEALKRNRVRAVFLSSGNLTGREMAEILVRRGRKIQDVLMSSRPPAAYTLTKDGVLAKIAL
jgi:hypothetical protein